MPVRAHGKPGIWWSNTKCDMNSAHGATLTSERLQLFTIIECGQHDQWSFRIGSSQYFSRWKLQHFFFFFFENVVEPRSVQVVCSNWFLNGIGTLYLMLYLKPGKTISISSHTYTHCVDVRFWIQHVHFKQHQQNGLAPFKLKTHKNDNSNDSIYDWMLSTSRIHSVSPTVVCSNASNGYSKASTQQFNSITICISMQRLVFKSIYCSTCKQTAVECICNLVIWAARLIILLFGRITCARTLSHIENMWCGSDGHWLPVHCYNCNQIRK